MTMDPSWVLVASHVRIRLCVSGSLVAELQIAPHDKEFVESVVRNSNIENRSISNQEGASREMISGSLFCEM